MTHWYGASYFDRSGDPLEYDNDFPSTANMAWGLYHYIFGFQPGSDRLTLAPFIAQEMVGSQVAYTFRGVELSVAYLGLNKFKVTIPSMPVNTKNIVVQWVNQTPGRGGYHLDFTEGGRHDTCAADAEGSLEFHIGKPGTYTLELRNPDIEQSA